MENGTRRGIEKERRRQRRMLRGLEGWKTITTNVTEVGGGGKRSQELTLGWRKRGDTSGKKGHT